VFLFLIFSIGIGFSACRSTSYFGDGKIDAGKDKRIASGFANFLTQ